jgi:hypothetical protein
MMGIATYAVAIAGAEAHAEQAIRNDPDELGKRQVKACRLRRRTEWDGTRRSLTPWQRYVKDVRISLPVFHSCL